MKFPKTLLGAGLLAVAACLTPASHAQTGSYKILQTNSFDGTGRIDYVYADNEARKLYIPRGSQILVFDEDSLETAGTITNTRAHGVAVDPVSHHGFSSSAPVAMWDTQTLAPIKTIEVKGRPDGILFEPLTERIYVLSHEEPNVTVLDGRDGSIVGTLNLGGEPEQGASDGAGRVYIDLENKDSIAVVDASTMTLTNTFTLHGKGSGPAGLGLDAKNQILFALCRKPAVAVILSAKDGTVITNLPIGQGTDGGGFNSNTMEAFSSQGDGTLTIIKESSPTNFVVSQTVKTRARAKTCTLDTKNNRIITAAIIPPSAALKNGVPPSLAPGTPGAEVRGRGQRGGGASDGPATLEIMTIGRTEMN